MPAFLQPFILGCCIQQPKSRAEVVSEMGLWSPLRTMYVCD